MKDFTALPTIKGFTLNEINPFGADFQLTMNFLNRINKLAKVDTVATETLQTCKNTNNPLYEVMVHGKFRIPDKMQRLLKPEFRTENEVIFVGKGKSITLARRAAFENLAKSIYSIMTCPDELLPSSESLEFNKSKFLVEVDVPDSASFSHMVQKFLTDCSAISESQPAVSEEYHSVAVSDDRMASLKNVEPLKGSLPIYSKSREIVDSVLKNQVTILSATTGSGKTTQIPKILRHHFESASIIVTQPRRVAAISLAERLAQEIDFAPVGKSVGYCVRFDAKYPTSNDSRILFCTSGLLLKKLMNPSDATLRNCTHLVLDEIHERDTNTDLLLLSIKSLVKRRSSLKIVIMSATLDAEKFFNYFQSDGVGVGRPIIIDSPTNFPIKTYHLEDLRIKKNILDKEAITYMNEELSSGNSELKKVAHRLIGAVIADIHLTKPAGSILCFLPGWEDIVAVKAALEINLNRQDGFKVFCVHSSSSSEESLAMFRPLEGIRKIILATNIAESSITIPDVKYVVDSGMQKIMSYKPNLRMNSLELSWISQANSLQRKGRIGRTQPGEYYKLWSKHRVLSPSLSPEILRVGLEDVCLTIKGLGFEGKCVEITQDLIDSPDRGLVRDAVACLKEIGAFEEESEEITNLGRQLASLPLGPVIGKALLVGNSFGNASTLVLLAASVGERLLKIPRFEEDKPRFFEMLRDLKSNFNDDFDFYLACLTDNVGDHIISKSAKRQCFRVAKSLASQLNIQSSPECPALSRLLWASALYPNIAFKAPRRNEYLLGSKSFAEIPKESILHRDSIETVIEEGLEVRTSAPKFILFEELFDAGYRMLMKSTAVDPIVLILFSRKVHLERDCLVVDNLIYFKASPNVINLLLHLRECWRIGSKIIFNPNASESIKGSFRDVLLTFAKYFDVSRKIEILKHI